MSKKIERMRRSLLPTAFAACLLALGASPLTAGGSATGHLDVRPAGLRISLGFHGHHGHYAGYHRYYRPYRYHSHYRYYRPYGYYPYRHYYPHFHYHRSYGDPRFGSRFGGLDLNVKPKKTTQVYVDGNYVGVTGEYDGWPEHLWLEKDHYELIFYNPGYKTVVRRVEVQPGVVIRIREEMQPGESTPVEELSTAKPKKAEPAPRAQRQAAPAPAPAPRERAAPSPTSPRSEVLDARQRPARLVLSVAPADASVYLDGQFLGIAGEIGEPRNGILVHPGEHRLEIVRPGYDSRTLRFEADAGGKVHLEVELQSAAEKAGWSV